MQRSFVTLLLLLLLLSSRLGWCSVYRLCSLCEEGTRSIRMPVAYQAQEKRNGEKNRQGIDNIWPSGGGYLPGGGWLFKLQKKEDSSDIKKNESFFDFCLVGQSLTHINKGKSQLRGHRAAVRCVCPKSPIFNFGMFQIQRRKLLSRFFESATANFPLIGMIGAAVIAALWFFDLPYFLSSALFSLLYNSLIYLYFYIDIMCSVYARTKEFIQKKVVKHKERLDFFQKVCYIFACFCFFIYSYKFFQTLPEVEESKKDLVNPLQVVAQLSCFFFFYKYKRSDVRERQLSLLCFVFCVISTLYILKVKHFFLCFLISIFCFFVYKGNIDYVPLAVLLYYTLDGGLAKWAFFLLFQQFAFYALSISLDREQTVPKKQVIFAFFFVLCIQVLIGKFFYQDFYLKELKHLAVLLSGASIVFICLKKRKKVAFQLAFFIYFLISFFIGLASLQGTMDLISLSIFVMGHVLFQWGLLIFIFSSERRGVVPFLFYTLFYILPYFPHIQWMAKWIEGFDLLLFFLSLFSFIEESKGHLMIESTREFKGPERALRKDRSTQPG